MLTFLCYLGRLQCTYIILCVDEHIVEFQDDSIGSLVGRWQRIWEQLCTRGLRKCLKIGENRKQNYSNVVLC